MRCPPSSFLIFRKGNRVVDATDVLHTSSGDVMLAQRAASMNSPLVTIGLPVFNASRFLPECLDSLVGQSYANLRIVISDNASSDDTLKICERYAASDSRVRIERADRNRGAGWNHQRVLEHGEGAYFKWCGADDRIGTDFVAACVRALEASPTAVLAYPRTVIIDENGVEVRRTTDHLPLDSSNDRVRFEALLSPWPITHSPFYGVMRRSALSATRRFGDFLAADRTFLADLVLTGPFIEVDQYLMFRRYHTKHAQQTEDSERALMNPDARTPFRTRELRVLREHFATALRARPISTSRFGLIVSVAAWAVANRRNFASELRAYASALLRPGLRTS